jgi:hypothetical protein
MLHPSILAASSKLTGIRSKKPLLIIVQNAMTVDTYTTNKAALLSTNPSLEKIVNNENKGRNGLGKIQGKL